MAIYTQQEIEDHYRRLPETLRDQLISVENAERIFESGKKFGLNIEQIGYLAEESGFVVLGLTHPKDFVRHLSEHLGVDIEKSKAIAREINHQVFFPLREMLKNAHQFELTQEQIQEPPPPLPTVSRSDIRPPTTPPPSPLATPTPIPTPTPLKPIMPPSAPITPPLRPLMPPPTSRQPSAPVPLAPLPSSSIQEQKTEAMRPPSPLSTKTADIIKPISPPAPSQIMQQKLLEEREKKTTPIQPDAEKIKGSIFAPPSVPAETKKEDPKIVQQTPSFQAPQVPTPPALPATAPIKPVYPNKDPYREPIE
ncbi:MAG: hypothetical protein U1A25_03180 [Candidatus Sungbacteria bacterium]|nr:hypothetical protein [bacterium]MDZ4260646.1 hypothetical protein [Candidatus Sungbacteria bacterium]